VVIENVSGAGGNLGGDRAAKAAPDGYTILMATNASLAINPASTPRCPTTGQGPGADLALGLLAQYSGGAQ